MFEFLRRNYVGFVSAPKVPKKEDALRFGLLGASFIAPMALMLPAKSHPEVILSCVAARDRGRAEAYAKKHKIPVVHDTYEDVINDPSISCVYIPLPNSHHYEWALRAIKTGKHVLLEKPCTSNAVEAKKLFNHPLVTAPGAPVLLEAFHYRFHPAWQRFMELIHADPSAGPVKKAYSQQFMPKYYFAVDDIRFVFSLAGGCIMDFADYNINCIREILDDPHPQVQSVDFRMISGVKTPAPGQQPEQIDEAVSATYKSHSGAEGRILADIRSTGRWPWFPSSWTCKWPSFGWPKSSAELEAKLIDDPTLNDGETHYVQRTVTLFNHLFPTIYNCIVVEDTHTIRRRQRGSDDDEEGEVVVRSWTDKKEIKTYDWPDKSDGRRGADWWTTYRYQLEEFVNRVKGRKGSGVWIEHQDSISQMEVMDETYEKGGLKIRPTSSFDLE